jgi:PLP dependent protein
VIPSARIEQNLKRVRERIREAAERTGRAADSVRLIAVTKTVGLQEIHCLHDLGVREFGENRIEVARDKTPHFDKPATWHMIGNIQRRKCPDVVDLFDCVDAVDRVTLALALNKRCEGRGEPLPILIEVNVSGEESKHGLSPDELPWALEELQNLENLRVDGLMTMAPFVDDPEQARPLFAALRAQAEKLGLSELSMGMTNDFEVAIEEGATQVRVGSALFTPPKGYAE